MIQQDEMKGGVKVSELVEHLDLAVVNKGEDFDSVRIDVKDVNRPGLQLMGFFDYFDAERLQIIGKSETAMIEKMRPEQRRRSFDGLFSRAIPALVIARWLPIFRYKRTLLRTKETTINFTSKFIDYLNRSLAPTITRHGVLLDISGQGVLIVGDSGIGKSETAIELIKRGHRLVSDDAVEIQRVGNQLFGKAPELIRHYMELRGIGLVNVRQLFGMGAVMYQSQIDLVVEMEHWKQDKFYDRLGLDEQMMNILGVDLPCITIPVMPGRNLAVIVEVAAMNNRHKRFGHNTAEEFVSQYDAVTAGGGK